MTVPSYLCDKAPAAVVTGLDAPRKSCWWRRWQQFAVLTFIQLTLAMHWVTANTIYIKVFVGQTKSAACTEHNLDFDQDKLQYAGSTKGWYDSDNIRFCFHLAMSNYARKYRLSFYDHYL